MPLDIWQELAGIVARGERAVLATIIQTRGSTPGKMAFKFLVRDDGTFVGTVGGGCLEAEVWSVAREVLRTEEPRLLSFRLTPSQAHETGLVCGGEVQVFVEPIVNPTLFMIGGGHVGKAVYRLARLVDLAVAVVDDRPEYANPERYPEAKSTWAGPLDELFPTLPIRADSFVVIATRGHEHDELATELALATPARYVGLIGSKVKRRLIEKNLRERGAADEVLARLESPAGLDIGARTAEEIALAVLAQVVKLRRTGEAGYEVGPISQ